ncbi:MAG: class 1 fructose-bisphosphatase [Pseudomonadota bacterium]|nr:class 1 fructose-bisphosphatase [Pseudomonadota bacterium]
MDDGKTLTAFLSEERKRNPHVTEDLAGVVEDMARACKLIAHKVSRGALSNVLGSAGSQNIQGETQKKLDIIANDIVLQCHESTGRVAAMASEEMDSIYLLPIGARRGDYLLVFDPLDGSTNIDVNLSIGTIFSILPCPRGVNEPREEDFLQPGRNQVCAGYVVYGPSTVLVLSLGSGVHSFTLDRNIGEFIHCAGQIQIPKDTAEYAINSSNRRFWEPPIARYIDECKAGAAGPREKNFNMRWVGAMVADCHRVICRGGIFLYPRDTRDPNKPGKLRLLYEANPISYLFEQAGGECTTGYQSILDITPETLHQRVPVIVGSAHEVAQVRSYHETDEN